MTSEGMKAVSTAGSPMPPESRSDRSATTSPPGRSCSCSASPRTTRTAPGRLVGPGRRRSRARAGGGGGTGHPHCLGESSGDLVGRVGAAMDGVRESPLLRERVRESRSALDADLAELLIAWISPRLAEFALDVGNGSIVNSGVEGHGGCLRPGGARRGRAAGAGGARMTRTRAASLGACAHSSASTAAAQRPSSCGGTAAMPIHSVSTSSQRDSICAEGPHRLVAGAQRRAGRGGRRPPVAEESDEIGARLRQIGHPVIGADVVEVQHRGDLRVPHQQVRSPEVPVDQLRGVRRGGQVGEELRQSGGGLGRAAGVAPGEPSRDPLRQGARGRGRERCGG